MGHWGPHSEQPRPRSAGSLTLAGMAVLAEPTCAVLAVSLLGGVTVQSVFACACSWFLTGVWAGFGMVALASLALGARAMVPR